MFNILCEHMSGKDFRVLHYIKLNVKCKVQLKCINEDVSEIKRELAKTEYTIINQNTLTFKSVSSLSHIQGGHLPDVHY